MIHLLGKAVPGAMKGHCRLMREFLALLQAIMPCPVKNEELELLLSQEEDKHS